MFDIRDITFTIPFRKDSDERLENLLTVIKYLKKYFDTNILVCEQDDSRKFPEVDGVEYEFIPTGDYKLLRTQLLNKMARMAKTPYIANYDTDVILKPEQYVDSVRALRENIYDGVFPYDGRFFNFITDIRRAIIDRLDVSEITDGHGHINHPNSVGGALFWNKQKFIEGGMENENFKSWGWEDTERACRFAKLGYRLGRVQGILYHLNHPTSQNSSNTNHAPYQENQAEYYKVARMSKQELQAYVNSWTWNK